MVTGQAPVTLEWRKTPGEKNPNKAKVLHAYQYIVADAIYASVRKTWEESEFESQPTMCQVLPYWRLLLAPEKNDCTASPPRKDYHVPGIYYT